MTIIDRPGPTPNGGVRSSIAYLDDDWNLVDPENATQAEITEYDAQGNVIATTMGIINRRTGDGDNSEETPA